MTTYSEQELFQRFKHNKEVTITVVGYEDGDEFDLTFTSFEECKMEIQHYEQSAEVYF